VSGSARIQTIDAVALLAAALRQFGEESGTALIDLDMEVNRAMEWIQHERRDYWENQVRRAWEQIDEARAELERCMRNAVAGQRPSCYEEKKALDRAKRRQRVAEEKVEAVRRWSHTADRESLHYRVAGGQFSGWLQAELPQAVAVLERMQTALEAYVSGPAPAGGSSTGESPASEPSAETPGEAAPPGTTPAAEGGPAS
jgi:exonuclease VII large subunit